MGRESTTGAANPAFDSTQDIDFDHEAELTHSGRFVIATDERGGGILPPGASCSPGADNTRGNGGLHAYRVDELLDARPEHAAEALQRLRARLQGRQGDLPRPDPHRAAGRRSAPRTCSSRSRARTGSSWAGTRRAPRSWTSRRTPTARSTSRRPAASSRRTPNSGSPHIFKVAAQRRRHVHLLRRDGRLRPRRGRAATPSTSTRSRCRRRPPRWAGTGTQGAPGLAERRGRQRALARQWPASGAWGRRAPPASAAASGSASRARRARLVQALDVFRPAKSRSITKLERVEDTFRSRASASLPR